MTMVIYKWVRLILMEGLWETFSRIEGPVPFSRPAFNQFQIGRGAHLHFLSEHCFSLTWNVSSSWELVGWLIVHPQTLSNSSLKLQYTHNFSDTWPQPSTPVMHQNLSRNYRKKSGSTGVFGGNFPAIYYLVSSPKLNIQFRWNFTTTFIICDIPKFVHGIVKNIRV